MDFIKLISAIQKDKNLSDTEVSKLSGISEYTYYNLKKYRIYLSKVGYFALCGAFKLNIENDDVIEEILNENRNIVGLPKSNLSIAAECVNPEYLEKMELELSRLKDILDRVENKDKVISLQYIEIDKLKRELEDSWKGIDKKVQDAYSQGVKESLSKFQITKDAQKDAFIMELNREYTERINKLEIALNRVKSAYDWLNKEIENYNLANQDNKIKLGNFEDTL